MTSPSLDSTHDRQRRVWHDITALALHSWSDDVGRGMTSLPLDTTHGRTTSDVECHHSHWVAHTVERRRAWHAIIALGRQTRSNNVRREMPSPPLDSIHDRTTLGMACHHYLWAAHMIERRRVRHAIITFRQHIQSNDVGRGMTSPHLDYMHCQTTSGVARHHHP